MSYVGDGTASKVISLNFTPRHVVLIRNNYNSGFSVVWWGDLAQGWALLDYSAVGFRAEIDSATHASLFPFVTNGFDVGKSGQAGKTVGGGTLLGNVNGVTYTMIALG